MGQKPRVTVAIPLYRAAPFVDVIRQNIEAVGLPDAEILVSDRHGFDDALAQLRRHFGRDERVVFLEEKDQIGWVDHYNALLQRATGRYFMWMPQDDSFPEGYVATLVAELEAHPGSLLGFGPLYTWNLRSGKATKAVLPKRYDFSDRPWRPLNALHLAVFWNLGIPFRGVFDRERILHHRLLIRHVPNGDPFADAYWTFAVALHGKLRYVARVNSLKRYHPANTHQKWDRRDFFYFSATARRVMHEYLDASPLNPREKFAVKLLLWANGVVQRGCEPLRPWLRRLPGDAVGELKNALGLAGQHEIKLEVRNPRGHGSDWGVFSADAAETRS